MIDRNELHSLADDELSAERSAELLALMSENPHAQREFEAIRAVKQCLKANSTIEDSPELWSRCQSRLDEIDKSRRIEGFVGRYAWGICGVFFIAIAMGGFFNRFLMKSVDTGQVAGYVAAMSPIPVSQSRNQGELDPVFKQILGESFNSRPPEIRVTAVGANNTPGNRLTFMQLDDGFGPVAVVALHDVQNVSGLYEYEQDSRFKYAQIDGVSALFWNRSDGVICVAFGNRDYSEIYRIVTTISD
jgi:hypothetical protein